MPRKHPAGRVQHHAYVLATETSRPAPVHLHLPVVRADTSGLHEQFAAIGYQVRTHIIRERGGVNRIQSIAGSQGGRQDRTGGG